MNKYNINALKSLNASQISFILENKDKMIRKDIALELGIPEARIKRAAAALNISFSKYRMGFYSEDFKKEIIELFESGGKRKVLTKYPGLRYRSIVERNQRNIALIKKWTLREVATIIKMLLQGCTCKEIAKRVGCSVRSVNHKLRRVGVTKKRIKYIPVKTKERILEWLE